MLLPNLHSNLGSAYLILGNAKQAREHYETALRLNPDDRVAQAGLQRISRSMEDQASH
jgi:cytochrome c-type biogenesis protein CcmH/NrfG